DLAAYNTRENVADIADLRVALGIKEWNVYGVSYGTDLAQQLLRDPFRRNSIGGPRLRGAAKSEYR
ncbi:MAG: hypothetical protein QOI36_4696, partial [Pseudonocardiales bacterium]|nr:hypothetical protein [Pseudonocardiales bacterium]